MGGMAAQIPIKNDDKANNAALEKVGLPRHRRPIISAGMLRGTEHELCPMRGALLARGGAVPCSCQQSCA